MPNAHALHTAAREVAERIIPLETAIDESFSQAASLLAYLPKARAASKLPISVGNDAITRVLASLNAIAAARTEMVAAHAAFVVTGEDLRLPVRGFGSLGGCPAATNLQVVKSQAA
jgi:hypothetical protein